MAQPWLLQRHSTCMAQPYYSDTQHAWPNPDYYSDTQHAWPNADHYSDTQHAWPNPDYYSDTQHAWPNADHYSDTQHPWPNPDHYSVTQHALPNTDHYSDRHFFMEVKKEHITQQPQQLFTFSYIHCELWPVGIFSYENEGLHIKWSVNYWTLTLCHLGWWEGRPQWPTVYAMKHELMGSLTLLFMVMRQKVSEICCVYNEVWIVRLSHLVICGDETGLWDLLCVQWSVNC